MLKSFLVTSLLSLLLMSAAHSQQETFNFEFAGVVLEEALKHIVTDSGINLMYDPSLIEGKVVFQRIRNANLTIALRQTLAGTGLDWIILSSGTYVIIRTSFSEPSFGSFSGKVVDAETGQPLPGATIMLADASGGTATNLNGQFNLNRLVNGTHEFVISYIGYNPVTLNINIPIDDNVREVVALTPDNIKFNPVVIDSHRPMLSYDFNAGELNEINNWSVNSNRNPIRSISMFSGVQNGQTLTDLHIQGSQRTEHRLFLDGIPLYLPYQNIFWSDALSPFALSRISVDRAGFGAESGSYIAGKVNLHHQSAQKQSNLALIQADPLSSNLLFNLKDSSKNKASFYLMGALRTSIWDLYQNRRTSNLIQNWEAVDPITLNLLLTDITSDFIPYRNINTDVDLNFYDVHLAGGVDLNEYNSITASFYSGGNTLNTEFLSGTMEPMNQSRMFANDHYSWNTTLGQITYSLLASPRATINVQSGFSQSNFDHLYTMLPNDLIDEIEAENPNADLFNVLIDNKSSGVTQKDSNEIQHVFLKADATYSVSSNYVIKSGLKAETVSSDFALNDIFYLETHNAQTSWFLSNYITNEIRFNSFWNLNIGSRFTYAANRGAVFAEPRLSIQYDRSNTIVGYWSARLSGGLYRQFINQFEISTVGPSSVMPYFTVWSHDNNLEVPKAYHGVLSLFVEPTPNMGFRIESYAKIQPVSYITSYQNLMIDHGQSRTGLQAFSEVTDINTFGVSFRYQQSALSGLVNLMAGYDYTYSLVNMDSQFGRRLIAPWNEPHRFQLRILGRLSQTVSVVSNWQSVYGKKWGFRQSYYDFMHTHNMSHSGEFNFLNPENDTLAPFHQLDFALIYSPTFQFADVELRVDLVNVLNRKNEVDWNIIQPGVGENLGKKSRKYPGFSPNVSFTLKF